MNIRLTLELNLEGWSQSCSVDKSTKGPHYREKRWELNCSPPQRHKLSSHCLGPSPGAGVIAAVWHCGEYFAFLHSQGNFLSLTLQPAIDKMCLKALLFLLLLWDHLCAMCEEYQGVSDYPPAISNSCVQCTDRWMSWCVRACVWLWMA